MCDIKGFVSQHIPAERVYGHKHLQEKGTKKYTKLSPSCFCKYSSEHQMCINPRLKKCHFPLIG